MVRHTTGKHFFENLPRWRIVVDRDGIAIEHRLVEGRRIDTAHYSCSKLQSARFLDGYLGRGKRFGPPGNVFGSFLNRNHTQTAKKLRSMSVPVWVRKLSGWNCNPNSGMSR